MDSICPSQVAHWIGAKLNPKIRISPRYGLVMDRSPTLLALAWVNALKGDEISHAQCRHQVRMWDITPRHAACAAWQSMGARRRWDAIIGHIKVAGRDLARPARQGAAGRSLAARSSRRAGRREAMVVRRDLLRVQRDVFGAGKLADHVGRKPLAGALMDCNPGLQIRQRESADAVAAIGGADEVEERRILIDRYELAIAKGPAGDGEGAAEHDDLSDKWLAHGRTSPTVRYGLLLLVARRENARQRDAIVDRQVRLDVAMSQPLARHANRSRVERSQIGRRRIIEVARNRTRRQRARRTLRVGSRLGADEKVGMSRHGGVGNRDLLCAAERSLHIGAVVRAVHGNSALQIGQGKVIHAVATVHGAEQRKQRSVLLDRQQLSVTLRPVFGCKADPHHSHFAQERIRHWHAPAKTAPQPPFPTQTQVLDGFKYNRQSKAAGRPQGLAFRPVLPY